jgi:type I restriction enzyme, S subunit
MMLVGPEHLDGGGRGRLTKMETAGAQDAISGKYQFEPGDVVYSKIRPELRKAWVATAGGLCSADMYPLRAHSGLSSEYLGQVILGDRFSRFAAAVSGRSSGMPKINRTELSEFKIPLPDWESQCRVAQLAQAFSLLIDREAATLTNVISVRSGLAADLLSGGVRTVAA